MPGPSQSHLTATMIAFCPHTYRVRSENDGFWSGQKTVHRTVFTPAVPGPAFRIQHAHQNKIPPRMGWDFVLAESVGFEPTVPCGITGFQDRLVKPLRQLSITLILYPAPWEKSRKTPSFRMGLSVSKKPLVRQHPKASPGGKVAPEGGRKRNSGRNLKVLTTRRPTKRLDLRR